MIDWKMCSKELPEDGQECILYSDRTDAIVGPITYDTRVDGWMDILATKEAGHIYRPGDNGPTHWAIWNGPDDAESD